MVSVQLFRSCRSLQSPGRVGWEIRSQAPEMGDADGCRVVSCRIGSFPLAD